MIGERIFPHKFGGRLRLSEGGYGKDLRGQWWVRPPEGNMIKVKNEDVVEHADGTISVQVGINGHGLLLEHGTWRKGEL